MSNSKDALFCRDRLTIVGDCVATELNDPSICDCWDGDIAGLATYWEPYWFANDYGHIKLELECTGKW